MGIRLESAKPFFQNETELTRWSVGNVGIEAIANPGLYARIIDELLTLSEKMGGEHLRIADFGAGSLRLERDLFCEDAGEIFGLRRADALAIENFRKLRIQAIAYETSASFLRMGAPAIPETLTQSGRMIIKHHDCGNTALDLADGCLDFAVSRNYLMSLSARGARFHLCEAARVLKPRRRYLAVVLNPEYQRRKLRALDPSLTLAPGDEFAFPRGEQGTASGFYSHVFHRSLDYVDLFCQSGFEVADVEPLTTPGGWEAKIPRYYDPFVPVFLLITAIKI